MLTIRAAIELMEKEEGIWVERGRGVGIWDLEGEPAWRFLGRPLAWRSEGVVR